MAPAPSRARNPGKGKGWGERRRKGREEGREGLRGPFSFPNFGSSSPGMLSRHCRTPKPRWPCGNGGTDPMGTAGTAGHTQPIPSHGKLQESREHTANPMEMLWECGEHTADPTGMPGHTHSPWECSGNARNTQRIPWERREHTELIPWKAAEMPGTRTADPIGMLWECQEPQLIPWECWEYTQPMPWECSGNAGDTRGRSPGKLQALGSSGIDPTSLPWILPAPGCSRETRELRRERGGFSASAALLLRSPSPAGQGKAPGIGNSGENPQGKPQDSPGAAGGERLFDPKNGRRTGVCKEWEEPKESFKCRE